MLFLAASSTGKAVLKSRARGTEFGVPQLGYNNDVIVVGEVDSYWHSEVSVTENLKSGDYNHDSSVYLVRNADLRRRENISSPPPTPALYNERADDKTGEKIYINAIDGSRLSYRICLASEDAFPRTGLLYIFDNVTKYYAFASNGVESIANWSVQIGTRNASLCTTRTYNVSKSSYYFIAVSTPDKIYFQYNYTFTLIYYDRLDYEESCVVNRDRPCILDLPKNSGKWTVLAYVHPLDHSFPVRTHLMLTASGMAVFNFSALSNFFTSLVVVSIVIVVLVPVCALYKLFWLQEREFCGRRDRTGYDPL